MKLPNSDYISENETAWIVSVENIDFETVLPLSKDADEEAAKELLVEHLADQLLHGNLDIEIDATTFTKHDLEQLPACERCGQTIPPTETTHRITLVEYDADSIDFDHDSETDVVVCTNCRNTIQNTNND